MSDKKYTPHELLAFLTKKYKYKKCKTKETKFKLADIYQYVYRKQLPRACGGNRLEVSKDGGRWVVSILEEISKENRGENRREIGRRNLILKQNDKS